MKIRLVTGAYYPSLRHGGPVVTNHCLAKALKALGHQVSVLTTDIDGDDRLQLESYDSEWDGVPVRYCRCDRLPLPYLSLEMYSVLREQDQPDIVLLSSAWAMYGITVGSYCRKNNIPYIVYAHGSHDTYRMSKGSLKKKIFWSLFDKKLYRCADALVALTENEKKHYLEHHMNDYIDVIPNGVSLEEKDSGNSSMLAGEVSELLAGRKYVLFLGRIEPVKGIDLLVEAMASVEEMDEYLLVIAGPDEDGYLGVIKEIILRKQIEDKVIFTGRVAGEVKSELYRNASVFALTSRGEGLPMAVLEAMAYAKPVLITRQCNVPEVEEYEAGVIVEPEVDSIVNGFVYLMSSDTVLMGESGKKLVDEKFTWSQVAYRTQQLCENVLGKRYLW